MSLLILLTAVSLVSMLAGVCLVLFWAVPKVENRVIFRPMREIFKTPIDFGIPFDAHVVETRDGCRLSGWHLCPPEPLASVIYFHGNSGNLGLYNEIYKVLYQGGFQVFAVDYRGYGQSTGIPTEKGLYRDAQAVIDYFDKHLRIPRLPVLYWGRSLGGCIAAWAAARWAPDGLILETAFASKRALLRNYPQFRFFSLFSRSRLNTARHLRGHRFPVLVVHGTRDRTVPIEQGRHLFELLSGPKEFLEVNGADHVNIHRSGVELYLGPIQRFAEEVRPPTIH